MWAPDGYPHGLSQCNGREDGVAVNCLEFCRRLYVNPYDRDPALARHRAECESCSQWHGDLLGGERQLKQAVDVPVPPDLAARILLRQTFLRIRRPRPTMRSAVALAASFLLGFGVAGALFWTGPTSSLARDLLSHVDELGYVLESKEPIGDAAAVALLDWMGADVRGRIGDVQFANLCTLRDHRVAHLVIAGTAGPVTIMIMPAERIRSPTRIEDGHRRGRIAPYRGGALAIVSEQPELLDAIEERVRSTLEWRVPDAHSDTDSA